MLPFHAAPALDSGLCQVGYDCDSYIIPFGLFLDNQLPVQGRLLACVLCSNHHPPSFSSIFAASPRTNHMATLRSYSPSVPSSVINFKPTPREVLGGIAPHLFGERPRRRSSASRTRSEVHLAPTHKRNVSSSPLRVSAILTAWDENGQLMGRSEQELELSHP
ncbi:hypothetical protein BDN71DRAFT_201548 [Pleurotus eryngii]|uniref:Uncharacterized protein n=1 Tax=Pleurotus eryngii TaxID=5323 RepID=A0A9P5ZR17_PLEER|nr:hypothetical protein BDN71DRAFT_201548 [Pleurotus eryngii]